MCKWGPSTLLSSIETDAQPRLNITSDTLSQLMNPKRPSIECDLEVTTHLPEIFFLLRKDRLAVCLFRHEVALLEFREDGDFAIVSTQPKLRYTQFVFDGYKWVYLSCTNSRSHFLYKVDALESILRREIVGDFAKIGEPSRIFVKGDLFGYVTKNRNNVVLMEFSAEGRCKSKRTYKHVLQERKQFEDQTAINANLVGEGFVAVVIDQKGFQLSYTALFDDCTFHRVCGTTFAFEPEYVGRIRAMRSTAIFERFSKPFVVILHPATPQNFQLYQVKNRRFVVLQAFDQKNNILSLEAGSRFIQKVRVEWSSKLNKLLVALFTGDDKSSVDEMMLLQFRVRY